MRCDVARGRPLGGVLLAVVICAVGCMPVRGTMPSRTWRPGEARAKCSAAETGDLLGGHWSATARADLESKLVVGLPAVVSAVGCRVDVLRECRLRGGYHYTALTPRVEQLEGAVRTIVGRWELSRGTVLAAELQGRCEAATHVVAGVDVGAYVPLAGEGGSREGDPRVCLEAETVAGCDAPVRAQLSPLSLGSFELTGKWHGVMRQPRGPYEVYDVVLDIEQQGRRVAGTSYLGTTDGVYWGKLRFEGRLEGNTLLFADARLIDDNLGPLLGWCLKGGFLIVDPRNESLHGPWRAFACAPGSLELLREPDTEQAPSPPAGREPVALGADPVLTWNH